MFGEKEIIGVTNQKIKDNRLTLPSFTHAEENDKLLVFKTPMYYFIYSEQLFNQKIKDLDEKISNCDDADKKKELRRIKKILYMMIERLVICNSKMQISLSGISINTDENVDLIGENRKLIIKPNK